MQEIGVSGARHGARDLWTHRDTTVDGALAATLPPHSAAMYLVHH
jgi:hypothetical protein